MKVLLIWPPSPEYCVLTEEFSCCEPLGLEYIAASLEKEHEVAIIDLRLEDEIEKIIIEMKPDVIGLSIPFTAVVNVCNTIMETVRKIDPNIKIIIGGHHPTVGTTHLNEELFDYIVRGEGVETFPKLLKAIEDNGDFSSIPGIAYKTNNTLKYTEEYVLKSLNDYPLPARHLTKKYRNRYFHAHYKPVTLMRFSYGCPYNCTFCILWKLCKRNYVSRDNDLIIKELESIPEENIYVVDDEAFINVKKMEDLADKILEKGIKKRYHMYVRADTVANNKRLFEKWAKIGLDSVLIGMESVFEEDLEQYNKGITQQTDIQALKILHENGVEVRANFIVQQDYTKEKFQQVKEAVQRLGIERPSFAVLTPLYGTDFYNSVKKDFIIDKPEFFDCYHTFLPTKLELKDFYKEFADLLRFANSRKQEGGKDKVFYAGNREGAFEEMLQKIEISYNYYDVRS